MKHIQPRLITLSLLVLFGCVRQNPSVKKDPEPVQPHFLVHTVESPGETLGKIAGWYTGSVNNWKKIAEINSDLNPKTLKIGDKIYIPYEIVKVSDPLPKVKNKVREVKKITQPQVVMANEAPKEEAIQPIKLDQQTPEQPVENTEARIESPTSEQPVIATPIVILDSLNSNGKSVDQLIAEEQQEIEKLQKELGTNSQE